LRAVSWAESLKMAEFWRSPRCAGERGFAMFTSLFLIGLLVLAAAVYFLAQHRGLPATGQYGGQPVPPEMYLDQQSGLVLPQGTQLATPGRRIGAFFLAIPLVIITLGIGYVVWGLLVWPNGQTPALQVLGMRCFRPEDNRVAGFGWMALR
jgi:hypothetical protein